MMMRQTGAALVAAAVVLMAGQSAFADENRFAVVTVNNNTPDVTMHFAYRWGNGEWKEIHHLKPGRAEWFAIPLDASGRAPRFEIKLNEAIGAALPINRTFHLRANAAPDRGAQFGHQHEILRDKNDRDYVSVFDMGR